jgi:rod shape-determining protein MreC
MHKALINFKTFVFLLVFCFVLIFLSSSGYLQLPKSIFLSIVSPIQSRIGDSSNWFGNIIFTVNQIGDFKNKSEELQIENQKLNVEVVRLKEVDRENQILKKELKFKDNLCGESDCVSLIAGNVVGMGLEDYGKSVTINIGSKQGAKQNQAVTVSSGVMIGKIIEVFEGYSKVALIISPESSVNSVAQTTRANGLVRGKYGTGLKLEMIDQSEELMSGDIVITSGLEEEIPKGLVIGKISNIEQSPNAIFKSADLELFIDFSHIEEVFLVKKNE